MSAGLLVLKRNTGVVQVKGSATACILRCLPDEGELHAANLGDSGFLLVRGGNPVFQTPQQQHHFNFPYQLGSKAQGAMNDGPESAQVRWGRPPACFDELAELQLCIH